MGSLKRKGRELYQSLFLAEWWIDRPGPTGNGSHLSIGHSGSLCGIQSTSGFSFRWLVGDSGCYPEGGRAQRHAGLWVLDDAHFPTGYANGRVNENAYARKRYLDCYHIDAAGPLKGNGFLLHLEEGEELVAVTAGKKGAVGRLTGVKGTVCHQLTELLDLTDRIKESLDPPGMNREKSPGHSIVLGCAGRHLDGECHQGSGRRNRKKGLYQYH